MKTELVCYRIREGAKDFYSLKTPMGQKHYALYLGEDKEHTWIHPIIVGYGTRGTDPKVCFLSVTRLLNSDIIIGDDEELKVYITNIPFGEMKHKSKEF